MDKGDLSHFHQNFYTALRSTSIQCEPTSAEHNSSSSFNCTLPTTSVQDETAVDNGTEIETSQLDDSYPDFSQIPMVRGVFLFLFITECFLGILGNVLVCLTVYRNKSMHSPVNYYIVNLGICDFLVGSFVLPMKLFELMADAETNMMNDFWCTVLRFLESVVVFASVFTLVAICIERYYAVVYPVHSRINLTDGRIRRVIALVWLVPIICAAPSLYPATSQTHILYSDYGEISRTTCFDQFSKDFRFGYFLFLFFFIYLIPLIFITTTCLSITRALMQKIPIHPRRDPRAVSLERGRRKVAKMVLIIVFAFLFCWSPYFIITVITQVYYNFFSRGQFFFTMLTINLFAFTHSCINPVVYFSMSTRFRKGFICILESLRNCMGKSRDSPEESTSTNRQTSHRQLNGPHTSYTDVYHCHNNPARWNSGTGRNNCNCCLNFRHGSSSTALSSSGKSPNQRFSRYSYNQEPTDCIVPKAVVLQYDSARDPQSYTELIPLQEKMQKSGNIANRNILM